MNLPGCKFSQMVLVTETMLWCCYNPQRYSVDAQKITIYADIPDTKENEDDCFFFK